MLVTRHPALTYKAGMAPARQAARILTRAARRLFFGGRVCLRHGPFLLGAGKGETMTGDLYTGTPQTAPPSGGDGKPDGQGEALFTSALIQAALSANRIAALVALLHDGPQLTSYTVSLALGQNPARVEQLAGAIAIAAGADSARVARQGGRLLVEIPKPPEKRRPLRPDKLEALTARNGTSLPLGLASDGRPVWFDLADDRTCHVVLGGVTGSGKTTLLHWILARLLAQNTPDELRLLLLDPKRGELVRFQRVPHLLHPPVSGSVDIARVLTWLEGELNRRAATGAARPRLVVVLEEVADVLKTTAAAGDLLARVCQIGRALGVHVVATTQQPGAKALGDSLVNFPARLVGRVSSQTLVYGATGKARTMADQLLGRGDFLLIAADGVTRFQAPMMTGRQWRALPRAEEVPSLEAELPIAAMYADLAGRDTRGGSNRRELTPEDYQAMTQDLEAGAAADDLRPYGIGYQRARRIVSNYREGRE